MKRFVDLNLQPSIKDLTQVKNMVSLASELGYHMIGINLPPNVTRDTVKQLQNICNNVKLNLIRRVDLFPKTPRELLHNLSRFRRKFEVISVVCTSKAVARQAAKDRRVDLLSFPSTNPRKRFFDNAEAELASKAFSSLEIDMAPLISSKSFHKIRLLSSLRKEVKIARKFNVPVTISSGATNTDLIRGPYDYAAITALFDMATPLALLALSTTPLTIVQRNKEKLSPNFVAPGIRVVRRKNYCPNA